MSALVRALAAIGLAGAALAASTLLTVTEREDFALLHAEGFDLESGFRVAQSSIGNAGADAAALGTDASPVEATAARPAARTAVARGDWTYAVTIEESAAASSASGRFRVEATMNGVPLGCVVIAQETREDAAVEGVVVTFAAGPAIDRAPLFFVRVTRLAGTCAGGVEYHDVTLGTKQTATGFAFTSEDGATENPGVTAPAAKTLRVRLVRGDASLHNIGIFSGPAATEPLAPGWSQNVDGSRSETTFEWRAPAAGTYEYRCQYHWTQGMKGPLTIT